MTRIFCIFVLAFGGFTWSLPSLAYSSTTSYLTTKNMTRYQKHYRTKKGLLTTIYKDQKATSIRRGDNPPNYTKEQLREWLYSQPLFHELFNEWELSGFDKMLVPSCELDRLTLMTWQQNKDKGSHDIRNGINNKISKAVIGVHKLTDKVVDFYSMREAERILKIANSDISRCCLGKSLSAGGYIWTFKT